MPIQFCHIKVTQHDLPAAVAVSIYSAIMTGGSAEATAKRCNQVAKKTGVNATYEVSTSDEYVAFRNARRAEIAAAQK